MLSSLCRKHPRSTECPTHYLFRFFFLRSQVAQAGPKLPVLFSFLLL